MRAVLVNDRIFCTFQNGSFPLVLLEAQEAFLQYFLWECCWAPGVKTHKSLRVPLWLGSLGIFTSQTCPLCASYNSSIIVQVLLPSTGSCRGFCSGVSAPVSCENLYSLVCLSKFGDIGLPCELTSLMDLTRIVDFSIYSAFYFLTEIEGQLPSMLHAGPETRSPLLFLVTVFDLKSILTDINIIIPALFWLLFAWNIIFHPFTFNLLLFLDRKWVSTKTAYSWITSLNSFAKLCLLFEEFNSFTFFF